MSHISFSELKIWNECPFKHKLSYLDKLKKFKGNEFTAFGKAVHTVCEKLLTEDVESASLLFNLQFLKELESLKTDNIPLNAKLVNDMCAQGLSLLDYILPAVRDSFGEFEVIAVEEPLYEDIEGQERKFKGFIDLVLKTDDGKYHIIDWKTCSWGWDRKRKSDKMLSYQLTLYKYYYAKKYDIDLEDIETYFALLKRTAKKDRVEIFRVSSASRKTQNAINFTNKMLYNVTNKKFIKNRLSCQRCEFYKTEYCT